MNTGGWAKVPGPLEDFRLTISNDQRGGTLDYAHGLWEPPFLASL